MFITSKATTSSSSHRSLPPHLLMASSLTLLSIFLLLSLSTLNPTLSSPLTSFVYGGCSHLKYTSDDAATYNANLNALLTSLVNSATYSSYNHLTIHGGQGSSIHGLYQCRGDLSMPDCAACVSYSATRLSGFCPGSCGAAIQLLGCFLKYDNDSFIGLEDKTMVTKRCGPSLGDDDGGAAAARDSVLDRIASGSGGLYRVGGSGEVQAMAQCVGDLSGGECNDCVAEAVRQVKVACGVAGYGDMYLGKCYVRYTVGGGHAYFSTGGSNNGNYNVLSGPDKNKGVKTFALVIGLLAAIAILIIFITFICRAFSRSSGGK